MNRHTPEQGWRGAVRGNVLMMGLVSLFTDASSEMIFPFLPVFLTGLVPVGKAAIYLGLMEGVAESTASLLKLFSGHLSDRLGKRKTLVAAGYGVSTVCRPLMALAGAAWHVIALRFCDRIGKGIRTSPRDSLISHSVAPEYRGLAFSFHRAMDHFGAILGPVAGVVVLYILLGNSLWSGGGASATAEEMSALRRLFAFALLPGIAAMAVIIWKVRELAPCDECGSAGKGSGSRERLPGKFYMYVSAVTLFALGNSSDLFIVMYGKTKFGMGLLGVIGVWVALHVSKVVFSLVGGAVSDRCGRRLPISVGWTVYGIVYIMIALTDKETAFWGLTGLYGLYYGLSEGVEKAMVADLVPAERRGAAYGIYHGATGIAALPASLLFGVFWAVLGPAAAFGIGAALAGAAAVLLLVGVRR